MALAPQGQISFTSFVLPDAAEFRTIWGSEAWHYAYYGACAPNPILHETTENVDNHAFAAKLVPCSTYHTAANKSYTELPGLLINDIASIECYYIEPDNGYAAISDFAK